MKLKKAVTVKAERGRKRERCGDKNNPRIAVTVKCKDDLGIAVKPVSINAWLSDRTSNLGSLFPEL